MARYVALACAIVALCACGPRVDLQRALVVDSVTTGWNRAASTAAGTKIVPVVSFRVRNVSTQRIDRLQINAVFHRIGDDAEWGSGFVPGVGTDGLRPGTDSDTVTVASPLGYTGTDPTPDLLTNSNFVDVAVRIFAKSSSGGWTRVGEYPIARRLVTGD